MGNTQRNSIGRKMIFSILVFALVIVVAVSVLVCYGFSVISIRHYNDDTLDFAKIAAHLVNGDKVSDYIMTSEKDESYRITGEFLTELRDEVELDDISVFVPYNDEVLYLWDTADSNDDYDLWEREKISSGYSEVLHKALDEEPSIAYFTGNGQDGQDTYLIGAYAPVLNSKGEHVAVVMVIRPKLRLKSIITRFIFGIALMTAVISAVLLMLFYALLKKNILRPIGILTESAGRMVDSLEREEPINIDIKTNDEFETLADAFTRMDIGLREYIRELSEITKEKERTSTELHVAAQIQRDMLPKLNPPVSDHTEFDLFAVMEPAKYVGGDFYDFFMTDDGHIALVMADVSGKGIPAALFMVVSKVLVKNCLKEGMSPAETLASVNSRLLENNEFGLFVTIWLAVIDPETGRGVAANAGHEHPALKRSGGSYELIKYKHSPAVAAFEGVPFREHEFTLCPGDTLFVYTDGVPESTNGDKEMFREERLMETLNSNADASPEELLKAVKKSIDEFVGSAPQFDDITMLAFRYNGR